MANRTGTTYQATSIHGYGTEWLIGDGTSPENFEAVPFVKTITPGEMNTADIDHTHLRSPEAHREHRPGLRDSGPFSVLLHWNPKEESQSNAGGGSVAFAVGGLAYLWRTRATRNMQLRIPDGSPETVWPFQGYISKYQPGEIGEDGIIPLMVEVTPTGDFSADLP
jgi:hypothetical protein